MVTQAELIAKNTPTTPKQFSFVLNNATQGIKMLLFAPDGWEDDEYVMTRDMKSFGVFRKFTAAEMKFPKDGRDYLELVYETDGVNADCTFTVTEITPSGITRNRFIGKIDFSTYKITELSVDVQVIDGAFTDLILTRSKTDVNLLGTKAIDGATLSNVNLLDIVVPEISIDQAGNMIARDTTEVLTESHSLQVQVINSDFEELTSTVGLFDKFFINSTQEYIGLIFDFDIIAVINASDTLDEFTINFYCEIWSGGVVIETVYTSTLESTGHIPRTKHMTDSLSLTLAVGDSIGFRAEIINTSGACNIQYSKIDYSLFMQAESIPERIFAGMLHHEVFDRLVQHYTGLTSRFKSDFLGRTDIGYSVDGGALGAITTGRYIRQKIGYNDTIPVSLENMFSSLQSMYCLGLGVETISGVEKLVIEEMAHFFDTHVILDISSRIAPETIEKQVAPEYIFNRISVGYNSYDYGKLGGIFEYNTTSKFTDIIKPVDKELNLISPYRADMSGFLALAKEPVENRDVSGEEDIFILDCMRSESGYKVRTTEGFEQNSNLGNKDILINLLISPARNLIRWGAYVRGWLDKYLTSSLIWQTSSKNTKLSSTITGETIVAENADILVSSLANPLWVAETFTIEVPALEADITAIKTNPYGLIKITDSEYGWILNFKSKNENKKYEYKLLRVNTTYVTPIELPT